MRIIAADHEPAARDHRYPACDAIEAHVDHSHEAADCGWLTMAEQNAHLPLDWPGHDEDDARIAAYEWERDHG